MLIPSGYKNSHPLLAPYSSAQANAIHLWGKQKPGLCKVCRILCLLSYGAKLQTHLSALPLYIWGQHAPGQAALQLSHGAVASHLFCDYASDALDAPAQRQGHGPG